MDKDDVRIARPTPCPIATCRNGYVRGEHGIDRKCGACRGEGVRYWITGLTPEECGYVKRQVMLDLISDLRATMVEAGTILLEDGFSSGGPDAVVRACDTLSTKIALKMDDDK